MRRQLPVGLAAVLLVGCVSTKLNLPSDPVTITVIQRHETVVPGSGDSVFLKIGDITAGQVLLKIRDHHDETILDMRSVRPGDTVPFVVGDGQYYLSVVRLRNFLEGDDFGVFEISQTPPTPSN